MLSVLGVGYPRTGTSSLCEALRILGYNAIHHAPERVPLFPAETYDWKEYDNVDAVTDAPACLYWRELAVAYPGLKMVLTVREPEGWWFSMQRHADSIRTGGDHEHITYSNQLHRLLFGCSVPSRYWWTRRILEHNGMVKASNGELLVMDIRDGWAPLCEFLGKPIPRNEFPWLNRS